MNWLPMAPITTVTGFQLNLEQNEAGKANDWMDG